MRTRRLVLAASFSGLLPALLAGCLDLARQSGHEPGDVAGRAVLEDGSPAVGATVELIGSGLMTATDSEGNFALRRVQVGEWLLRISADTPVDGDVDGVPDEVGYVEARIQSASHPEGLFGSGDVKDTFLLLGDVDLAATETIGGTIVVDDGAGGTRAFDPATDRARVVASRAVEIAGVLHMLPIEAGAGVAADGAWLLAGIAPGDVRIAAFAGPVGEDETHVATATAAPGDADVELAATVPVLSGADRLRISVNVEFQPALSAPEDVDVFPLRPGSEAEVAPRADVTGSTRVLPTTLPIGVLDVSLSSEQVVGRAGPFAVTPVDEGLVYGPVERVQNGDTCRFVPDLADPSTTLRDCDRDGRAALPFLDVGDPDADALATWVACIDACEDSQSDRTAVCEEGGEEFDCDDDGDTVPDIAEVECVGHGLGVDRDGDGLCEPGEDPFPACPTNDPAECPAALPVAGAPQASTLLSQ